MLRSELATIEPALRCALRTGQDPALLAELYGVPAAAVERLREDVARQEAEHAIGSDVTRRYLEELADLLGWTGRLSELAEAVVVEAVIDERDRQRPLWADVMSTARQIARLTGSAAPLGRIVRRAMRAALRATERATGGHGLPRRVTPSDAGPDASGPERVPSRSLAAHAAREPATPHARATGGQWGGTSPDGGGARRAS